MHNGFKKRPIFHNLLSLSLFAALTPQHALAQAQPDAANVKAAKQLQAVIVTGSHISNPSIVSPTPLTVLTARDIKAAGVTNIGELLATMPQLAANRISNSGFNGEAGKSNADLRVLGPARTLTLVNGRRFVGSAAGSANVNVNFIPVDWIERVDIITGGASAVYGADAIAGVVNFILKKNYRGAHLHAQMGTSQHGGFNSGMVSLTGGMGFAKDRGNVAVSVEHSAQGSLDYGERFGHQAFQEILTPTGPTDSALFANSGFFTITEGGTFSTGSDTDISRRYIFERDGSVRHQAFHGPYDVIGRCADCDYLEVNHVNQLEPSLKRTTLSSIASFDITPEHRLYAEGTYSHTDSTWHTQPPFGTGASAYVISNDSPFIAPGLARVMTDNGLESIRVSRFDTDAGLRIENTGSNTTRIVIGGNGVLAGDWEYDASLTYGVTDETIHRLNSRINNRFYASIDAVRDASGHVVCRSSLQPGSFNSTTGKKLNAIALDGGCVPTSIFGDGAISPAAASWFNTTTLTSSHLAQFVGGGTVTNNNLFQMPFGAGAASIAAGVEFRRETSGQINDPLDAANLTSNNAVMSSGGAYDVKEGYIETALPLLSDRPLIKGLMFDAAARFSSYNNVGRTKTWRWGLDWALDDNVRLRNTMSVAVRAPNIGELYSGQSQDYFGISDPCTASELKNAPNRAVRAANCQSLGIPAGWTSFYQGSVDGLTGSNPNLNPEKGRTWTAGVVMTPQFLPGFGLTLDYWHIRLTDAIASISGTDTANHCVDSTTGLNNVYCPNALRDPITHEVVFIRSTKQNISALSTSGVDINAYYSHPLLGGSMRWSLVASKAIAYTEHPFQDDPDHTQQDIGTGSYPAWKATLSATYSQGSWSLNWNTLYFSSTLRVSNESYRSNPTQTTPIRVGAGFLNNLQASYAFRGGLQAYLGLNNVFDRDPPVNVYGGSYDPVGRAYYAGFNYKF